ncbi:Aurofusarin cluster transcription factor aurR2 [Colletotrichum orbiculare MAFF 240422]|uniref:Aurofusarin cluster transcription factor aurR2 n=1 Tax=Colletotrichum orbiculare (strain 104-T / ATCC 96160 / CBS 514.97 / LARS 414 / MAFF 240422) TaxID=1213857 RepID=A0A484FT44_COLOR|nr:Aurofusarin cluster transcription factor aurR2 [Colletotrichum orbiculare MAFF 240422]
MTDIKTTRGHSCTACQHRKIRCNGHSPCAYCIKIGRNCSRPRRSTQSRPTAAQGRREGQVVESGDQRRYVEDNKLWTSLSGELGDTTSPPKDQPSLAKRMHHSAQTNFIFGPQQWQSPDTLHPSAVQSFKLFQAFLTNVHPLTKIVHGPSVQEEVLGALADPYAMEADLECLIFSIYLIAVVSLSDEECRALLDESKEEHLARYRYATEAALSRVDFLRSTDLKVLQAFTLYLLALRHLADNDVLWLLTGLATRMAQRMGLHRESSLQDLSPFDAEMRRRVWWQIIILDGRAAQVSGASMNPAAYLVGDTKQPANINDGDLVPSMSALPAASASATDMVFCSVRIEIGVWMMQQKLLPSSPVPSQDPERFLKSVDELEQKVHSRYLRNIDAEIPLNSLAVSLARSAFAQLRLSVCHPMRQRDRNAELSQTQLDMLLRNSLEVIRYDVLAHTTQTLRNFLWHISSFFPYETFVLLLTSLSRMVSGDDVERAWDVVNEVYEHHPLFTPESRDSLHRALGNLTLKSWDRRVLDARAVGSEIPQDLPCIRTLRFQRGVSEEEYRDEVVKYPPR